MDLVATLRKKIDLLDEGDYVPGLKAVLLHIETAFRHLSRGQDTGDDTAFTDAIYRTNQAFEGSVKEAFRVLAAKDPEKMRPYDIENYLEKEDIFRPRVLDQLKVYRKEWRNPSTHDYKLDFDESESFLAITSVSAFSCLLLDQISERIAFVKSQNAAEEQKPALTANLAPTVNAVLPVRITELLTQFCRSGIPTPPFAGRLNESTVIGALHGFLATAAPELTVLVEPILKSGERLLRPDLVIARGEDRIVVELKRNVAVQSRERGVAQVESYMLAAGIKDGILLFAPDAPSEMQQVSSPVNALEGQIIVLSPLDTSVGL